MTTFGIFTGRTQYGSKMLKFKVNAETVSQVEQTEEYRLAEKHANYIEIRPIL